MRHFDSVDVIGGVEAFLNHQGEKFFQDVITKSEHLYNKRNVI